MGIVGHRALLATLALMTGAFGISIPFALPVMQRGPRTQAVA
jgi:hypothetical protein